MDTSETDAVVSVSVLSKLDLKNKMSEAWFLSI